MALPHLKPCRLAAAASLAACALLASGVAGAQTDARLEHQKAEAEYRNAWASCKTLVGNAKDVCQVEARGNFEVAKAEIEARIKPTPKNLDKVRTEKAEASYRLAQEKCDDLKGGAKAICQQDAKTLWEAAKQDVKVTRPTSDKGLNAPG